MWKMISLPTRVINSFTYFLGCHSHESGNPESENWIPASAGMTFQVNKFLTHHIRTVQNVYSKRTGYSHPFSRSWARARAASHRRAYLFKDLLARISHNFRRNVFRLLLLFFFFCRPVSLRCFVFHFYRSFLCF